MRKILFAFLGIFGFFRKLKMKLFGKTENDIHDQRIVSGKAWEDFCDQLKLAGNVLKYPGTPQDAFDQAEGLRYLTRLTHASLEAFVEYTDPAFPVLRRMVHETVKMGADNPDNYYFNAQIDGSKYEYKITGNRNTVHYIGFFTQNGSYGTTGGLAPCGRLEGSDLVVEEGSDAERIGVGLSRRQLHIRIDGLPGLREQNTIEPVSAAIDERHCQSIAPFVFGHLLGAWSGDQRTDTKAAVSPIPALGNDQPEDLCITESRLTLGVLVVAQSQTG